MALDELHGVVADVSLTPDLEHRHDVGMVQPSRSACFTAESLEDLAIVRDVSRQHLECDPAAQGHLIGLVNDAHSAVADLPDDAVVADLRVGQRLMPRFECCLTSASLLAHLLGLLEIDQRREERHDVIGQFRMPVDVLFEARPLSAPISLGKFIGKLIQPVVVSRR